MSDEARAELTMWLVWSLCGLSVFVSILAGIFWETMSPWLAGVRSRLVAWAELQQAKPRVLPPWRQPKSTDDTSTLGGLAKHLALKYETEARIIEQQRHGRAVVGLGAVAALAGGLALLWWAKTRGAR